MLWSRARAPAATLMRGPAVGMVTAPPGPDGAASSDATLPPLPPLSEAGTLSEAVTTSTSAAPSSPRFVPIASPAAPVAGGAALVPPHPLRIARPIQRAATREVGSDHRFIVSPLP